MKKTGKLFITLLLALTIVCVVGAFPVAATDYNVSYPPDGYYTIICAANTNYAVDVSGGGDAPETTTIHCWERNQSEAQVFYIKRVDSSNEGWYTISYAKNGLVMNVIGGQGYNGNGLWLYHYDGTDACLWRFASTGDGNYLIQSKVDGGRYLLDLSDGQAYNSARLQLWQLHDSYAARYALVPVNTTNVFQPASYTVQTNGARLNVRASAGNGEIIGRLQNGQKVAVYEITNGWARIDFQGRSGYVSASYLRKSADIGNGSQEDAVRQRLDSIGNGSLTYNSSTVMKIGSTFSGTRANEQCKGYAKNCFYLCFNIMPGSTKDNNYELKSTKGMTLVNSATSLNSNSVRDLMSSARPGDFLQIKRSHGGPHSAIIYSISPNGATFLEANTDGRNTVFLNTYTWSQLAEKNSAMSLYTATNYQLA